MKNFRLVLVVLFLGFLTVSLNTCGGGSTQPISIAVTPSNPNLPVGSSQQLAATGTYTDGTNRDISTQVAWSSSNNSVGTVNGNGLVTAVAAGTATITAVLGTSYFPPASVSGNTVLTVTSATLSSIAVTPANPGIPVGVAQQFTAMSTYADGTTHDLSAQVVWSSSNTAVVTVNSNGLTTAVSVGTANIAATSGSISGSTVFTVTSAIESSLTLAPANLTLSVRTTQQFTATGTFSDGTTHDLTPQVVWSSSNPSVAIVDSNGLATALAAGITTITAASGTIAANTTLTVISATLSAIAITPANPSISVRAIQQFTATGTFSDGTTHDLTTQATWSSSNPSVATVNNNGLATAVATGTVTITATSGNTSVSTTFTVTL